PSGIDGQAAARLQWLRSSRVLPYTAEAFHKEQTLVMKFALFILASWTENAAAHQRRIYQEALEQVRYAEVLGFDAVWIAEHHSSRYGIFPSLMPILAHIAAQDRKSTRLNSSHT